MIELALAMQKNDVLAPKLCPQSVWQRYSARLS